MVLPFEPPPLRVIDIADGCRFAAITFLNGVLAGWGKPELAAWLGGSYAEITRHARAIAPPSSDPVDLVARAAKAFRDGPDSKVHLPPPEVRRLMRQAHFDVISTLRSIMQPYAGVSFAFTALGAGHVMRWQDEEGEHGWLPVAPNRMRLVERLLSLLAVDYLLRPEEYETHLCVCAHCNVVVFDAAARARGVCRVHGASGIRFRGLASCEGDDDDEPTLVGLG